MRRKIKRKRKSIGEILLERKKRKLLKKKRRLKKKNRLLGKKVVIRIWIKMTK